MTVTTFTLATAPVPGAIGVVQLHGPGVGEVIEQLTGKKPTPSRSVLADLGGIDEGLVVMLRDDWAQLMPHGGPRVMQRLAERFRQLGAVPADDLPPRVLYPEAADELEAEMLAALASAASPAAIDTLLDQPRRWKKFSRSPEGTRASAIIQHSQSLHHLLIPPSVVLVGRANVGKSTLTNLVMGRAASITADLPGTTRDWVAGLAELPTPIGELAVRWFDTPGVRDTDDPIERKAIELARRVIQSADVLIALRDPATDWPQLGGLREPDLWVMNKADLISDFRSQIPDSATRSAPLRLSALGGEGLDQLSAAVARALGLETLDPELPWAFSPRLQSLLASGDFARVLG